LDNNIPTFFKTIKDKSKMIMLEMALIFEFVLSDALEKVIVRIL
jgi:hypothetical protein